MKIKIIILFCWLFIYSAICIAQIQPGVQQIDMRTSFRQCEAYQKLTPAKQATVDQIIAQYKTTVEPIMQQLHMMEMMLDTQLSATQINEDNVNNLVTKISGLRNQIFEAKVQMRIQLVKSAGFNPAECLRSPPGEKCVGPVCEQRIPETIVAPHSGLEINTQHGLQPAPNAGLQTAPHSGQTPSNKQTTEQPWWK
jgi:hypothetical protein